MQCTGDAKISCISAMLLLRAFQCYRKNETIKIFIMIDALVERQIRQCRAQRQEKQLTWECLLGS